MSEQSKFKDALRTVLSVPKEKADARLAANKRRRIKKRRSKK